MQNEIQSEKSSDFNKLDMNSEILLRNDDSSLQSKSAERSSIQIVDLENFDENDKNNYQNYQTENTEQNGVVEKKKRGRKPKNYYQQLANQDLTSENQDKNENAEINTQIAEPKKRGRKAGVKNSNQNKQNNNDNNDNNEENNDNNDNNDNNSQLSDENNETKIKRRGRKSNTKIISINNDSNNESITNLIAHLPLKMSDIIKITQVNSQTTNSQPTNSQPTNSQLTNSQLTNSQPTNSKTTNSQPTNSQTQINKIINLNDDFFGPQFKYKSNTCQACSNCKTHEFKITELNDQIEKLKDGILDCSIIFNKKVYESGVKFYGNNGEEWPEKTDIHCWWCCHKFEHIPLGIPEYINKNIFYLSGCYCSFNCMMAYNTEQNDYKMYERQTNIYRLKNKIDPQNKMTIKKAGPRQMLQMFGGKSTIKEFRENFFVLNGEYRYFMPPMVSIVGIIEEDTRDISGKNKGTKNESQMLRRKKPLPRHTNGLSSLVSKI
jgi:hypothetical protein